MSKTVTIPTGGGNPFVVILGGVKYVYKPGETVEVPDGVALEIEEWERWHEKHSGENEPPFASPIDDITAEVGQTIVVKSVDENGKPTEWEAADLPDVGGGGSGGIGFDLVVHIDYSGEKWAEGNFEKAKSILLKRSSFPLIACVEFVGDGFESTIVSEASAYSNVEYIAIHGRGAIYHVFPDLTVTVEP